MINHIVVPDKASDVIKSFAYNRGVLTLSIKDRNTNACRDYAYFDVPRNVFEEMTRCESYGQFYNKEIKDYYQSERILITKESATIV